MPYAENTTVSPEKSRAEIERTLARYGATSFSYGWETADSITGTPRAVVQFRASDRVVRFEIKMPAASEFITTDGGRRRTAKQVETAQEQAVRQRWRALALVVKAKLEAVEAEITTFEEEFLAHIVLPDNTTFGQWAGPQLQEVYESGQMPALLPPARALLEAGQ